MVKIIDFEKSYNKRGIEQASDDNTVDPIDEIIQDIADDLWDL